MSRTFQGLGAKLTITDKATGEILVVGEVENYSFFKTPLGTLIEVQGRELPNCDHQWVKFHGLDVIEKEYSGIYESFEKCQSCGEKK